MTEHTTNIRKAAGKDQVAFLELWQEFVATDPTEPGDREMGPVNWQRFENPADPLHCIVATDAADVLIGFLIYTTFPFTWSRGDACYLQDLHVTDTARGRRVGQILIEDLAAMGRTNGWYKVFWLTQPYNKSAQRLYERIAIRSDFIRYDLPLE